MKRDKDLLRGILEHIEENDKLFRTVIIRKNTFTAPLETVKYHLRLLEDAGFIRMGTKTPDGTGVKELTWSGHEYLDELREK